MERHTTISVFICIYPNVAEQGQRGEFLLLVFNQGVALPASTLLSLLSP
jgi:hypothetical protein